VIRAVFFDAGATLIQPDPPVEVVYAREFSNGEVRFSDEDLTRALTRAWEQVHAEQTSDRYGGVRGEPDFWKTFLNRVRGHLDGGTVAPEMVEHAMFALEGGHAAATRLLRHGVTGVGTMEYARSQD